MKFPLFRAFIHSLRAALLCGLCAGASLAHGAQFEVPILHLERQDVKISPKVGDTIVFRNLSHIAHNLYLTFDDGRIVTLDTQLPGDDRSFVLDHPGEVVVRCWIHPIIRIVFEVEPAADAGR